jgi:hypothetical protein
MMNTLAVGNFRAVQVGTRMGSRVVQSEIKDVSYPGGDSVRVYVECHKDIYPDYSSLRVHMLTGGSKDDIHYMLDDRGSSTIAIQQSLTGTNRWIAELRDTCSTRRGCRACSGIPRSNPENRVVITSIGFCTCCHIWMIWSLWPTGV